jgi:hypothetical protein
VLEEAGVAPASERGYGQVTSDVLTDAVVAFLTSDEAVGRGYQVLMAETREHPVARMRAAILAACGVESLPEVQPAQPNRQTFGTGWETQAASESLPLDPENLPTQPGVYLGQRDTRWELDSTGQWWFRGYVDGPHPTPEQQDRTPNDVLTYGMPLRLERLPLDPEPTAQRARVEVLEWIRTHIAHWQPRDHVLTVTAERFGISGTPADGFHEKGAE